MPNMTYLRKKISCIYNFPGATSQFRSKKMIYVASFGIVLLFSLFVSIPATIKSAIFIDKGPPGSRDPLKQECRTLDVYTMVFSYFLGSSLLFCFTMSFLFSLCIVGSPYLRDVIDEEEYKQRYVCFFLSARSARWAALQKKTFSHHHHHHNNHHCQKGPL